MSYGEDLDPDPDHVRGEPGHGQNTCKVRTLEPVYNSMPFPCFSNPMTMLTVSSCPYYIFDFKSEL